MGFDKGSRGFIDTRLDTWKLIAQYLGRSSRTVQRWHSEYGLPVRHLGGDASSVFAYTDELDNWLRRRDSAVSDSRPTVGGRSDPAPLLPLEEHRTHHVEPRDFEPGSARKPEADELVATAEKLWESLSSSNLSAIARTYRKAIDLDGSSAKAFAGFSQALMAQAVLGNLHPSAALHPAEAALGRAKELDAELFETLCASAMLKILIQRDWAEARNLLNEALRHRPAATQALVGRAFCAVAQNSLAEGSEYLRRASMERPLNTSVAELLCWVEYLSGRFESALALIGDARETGHSGAILDSVEAQCDILLAGPLSQIQRLEDMSATSLRNYTLLGVLGFAYGRAGQEKAAREVIESMTHLGLAGKYDFAYSIALTFLGLGERPEAVKSLEQSYRHGSLWSLGFGSDPMLAELREDPAYSDFFGPRHYPQAELHQELEELHHRSMPYSA